VSEVNREYLLKGFRCAKAVGVNKALFKVRILKNIFGCSKEEVYSFFMGVILCDEILSIKKDESKNVVIGGRAQIKSAMALILKEETDKNVIELSEEMVDYSTSIGMIKVYEKGDK
jgi:2-keto-3-deoxy-galactonokinase